MVVRCDPFRNSNSFLCAPYRIKCTSPQSRRGSVKLNAENLCDRLRLGASAVKVFNATGDYLIILIKSAHGWNQLIIDWLCKFQK